MENENDYEELGPEKIRWTDAQIEAATDIHFPKRDGDDKPLYRIHQRQIIAKAIDHFVNNDIRAVILDAPVGSGKSVVNYTVARAMADARSDAVYITAQKSLQDQIDDDDFADTRCLKGRSSYRCNYAFFTKEHHCDCSVGSLSKIPGNLKTCVNTVSATYKASKSAVGEVWEWVRRMLLANSPRSELRQMTNFRAAEEVNDVVMDLIVAKGEKDGLEQFFKSCCCPMMAIECPYRSARYMAQFRSRVAVLNPDIYYLLKKVALAFIDRGVVVVDEAHRLEGAVQRMFRVELVPELFEAATGLSLSSVQSVSAPADVALVMDEMLSKTLLPLLFAGYILEKDSERAQKSEAGAEALLNDIDNDTLTVSGTPISQFNDVYKKMCVDNGCRTNMKIKDYYKGSYQQQVHRLIKLRELYLDKMVLLKLMLALKNRENNVFIKVEKEVLLDQAFAGHSEFCKKEDFSKNGFKIKAMIFVPMRVGTILQLLVFNGIDHVLLSSGTWPESNKQIGDLGFGSTSKLMKIPPPFPIKNRPIFVNNDIDAIDFSAKVPGGGGYVYMTYAGTRRFCDDLRLLIECIRKKLGPKTNVAVHTFSFAVSNLVAEHYEGVDENFLVHTGKWVNNRFNGQEFGRRGQGKEEVIARFCSSPGQGLTLVSPSIMEGLDFKYDICRAQIILKGPIPSLDDPYVMGRFKGVPEIGLPASPTYLDRLCAIDLNQTYGRVCRADDDWGETYVYDMAIAKRLAKAFDVKIPDLEDWQLRSTPGNMKLINLEYMEPAIQYSRNRTMVIGKKKMYDRAYAWPKLRQEAEDGDENSGADIPF